MSSHVRRAKRGHTTLVWSIRRKIRRGPARIDVAVHDAVVAGLGNAEQGGEEEGGDGWDLHDERVGNDGKSMQDWC